DRLARAAVAHWRAPHRLVPTSGAIAPPPTWSPIDGPPPAPLELPTAGVDETGVIDLGTDGAAIVCEATALNFGLRTEAEQEGLVAAFGRYLNTLTAAAVVVVRAERVDLDATVAALEDAARALPHLGLETAASEHAQFLRGLASRRDVLRRQILLVLREPRSSGD